MQQYFLRLMLLTWLTNGYAYAQPLNCPEITAIQRAPVIIRKSVAKGHLNEWYTRQVATFDTNEKWVFVIHFFKIAETPPQVMQEAKAVLQDLQGHPQPQFEHHEIWGDHWYCHYTTTLGYSVFAKTLKEEA